MKKLLTFLICLILVGAIVIGGIQLNKKFGFIDSIFNTFNSAVNSSSSSDEKPQAPNGKVYVTINYYTQNPETGEYNLLVDYELTDEGMPFSIQPTATEYYLLNEQKSSLSVDSATDQSELNVYFDCKTCQVTFYGGEGANLISGEQVQTVRMGQTPTPPTYERKGYQVISYTPEITKVYQECTFVANWQAINYTLKLNLPEGATLNDDAFVKDGYSSAYSLTFTIESEQITLPIPSMVGYEFLQWNTKADGSGDDLLSIDCASCNDIELFAIFNVEIYEMAFVLLGEYGYSFSSILAPLNYEVHAPKIAPENQVAGYGLNWYSDQECSNLYTFTVMPAGGVTLYGKWEEDSGVGMLEWDYENEVIDNYDEYVQYIDYVAFNYLTKSESKAVQISSSYMTDLEEIQQTFSLASKDIYFDCNSAIGASFSKTGTQNATVTAYVTEDLTNLEATKSTLSTGVTPYNLVGYAPSGRGSAFNDFYIDSLTNTYEVSTTNQLFYVVERGYKPLCVANSPAEKIYNRAKVILNSIIKEGDSDYQKALAIFEYLVMNVEYDNAILTLPSEENWVYYDAFYLEGVFDKNKAVCDGISKAYSLMCNMEGIPCLQVTGNSHAWCKVKIENNWTIVDPTHGNTQINGSSKSIMSHMQFGMTQAQKAVEGYSSTDYNWINANHSVNYFTHSTFSQGGNLYDFVIESVDELVIILKYANDFAPSLIGYALEFEFAVQGSTLNYALSNALNKLALQGVSVNVTSMMNSELSGREIIKLIFG